VYKLLLAGVVPGADSVEELPSSSSTRRCSPRRYRIWRSRPNAGRTSAPPPRSPGMGT